MVQFGQCALRVPEEQRGHFLGLVGLTAGRDPKIPSLPNRRMHGRLDPGVGLPAVHLGRSVAVRVADSLDHGDDPDDCACRLDVSGVFLASGGMIAWLPKVMYGN